VIMMDVFEAIRTRRSIRKYTDKKIEKEKLDKILEAGRLSLSANNQQPYGFVVVKDSSIIEKVSSTCNQDWQAPAMIITCAFPEKAWIRDDGEDIWKVDVAIALNNIVLTAWEEGLGTCWIAAFRENELKKVLGIPEHVRVISLTTLGYPAEEKGPVTRRKTIDELVRYDHW